MTGSTSLGGCVAASGFPHPHSGFGMAMVGHDGVVASMHVLDCGRGVVAIGRLGAGGSCVVVAEAKSVGPTVVHMKPVVSDNSCWGGCHRWNRDSQWYRQ